MDTHRVCIAPLMNYSDRHFRYLMRLFSPRLRLYTEMLTTGALLNGDRAEMLRYDAVEHPLALQLGGSDPEDLAACAGLAAEAGYDEVNLNVGCPSDRVQRGRFGACLMKEPELVAECVDALRSSGLEATVKCRIGVDERDSFADLSNFAGLLWDAGCRTLIVHARIAILQGLSPKENRSIPPLRYKCVYRLKSEFPRMQIIINGGIDNLDALKGHLEKVDGVMIGRAAYQNPWLLAELEPQVFDSPVRHCDPQAVVMAYLPYIEARLQEGVPLMRCARHLLNLFKGRPGAAHWRQIISQRGHAAGAGVELIHCALEHV
ncbi:MAG: tRNA dihydrouridine(20/20a) synthase DusA [Candidatus Eutrophobiaceae bacterium]